MKLTEPQALYRIAAYCSTAERCEYEVLKKLKLWELQEEPIARILSKLHEEGFVNEERFCRSFINDKIQFNKWGKTKIIYELKKRSIASSSYNSIFEELASDVFETQLLHVLLVKERSVKAKDVYDKKTKLIRFALSRGFAYELAVRCVSKILGGGYDECLD